MLWVQRAAVEKCADIDLGYMTARGRVRFMPDEHALRIGLAAQKPAISAGAAIKLSCLDRHRICPSCGVRMRLERP